VERPPPGGRDYYRQCLNTLKTYLPVKTTETDTSLTLADFYDAVHVPSTDEYVPPRVQQSLTDTQLFPFQQRAVKWLLGREGVEISPSGEIRPVQPSTTALPLSFQSAQDATGQTCYVSHMRGMIIKDPNDAGDMTNTLRGGILAEEMGLGKTIELIALMSLHRRGVSGGDEHDHYLGTTVKRSPATLIISPPSILEQWTHELNRHAPGLKVLHYKGLSKSSILKESSAEATVEYLMQFDVVLTTYQVLSKEIHFTMPAPDRSLRKAPVYKHKKSPLVEIGWWRVCLDEAQMVENGVSQAATVARTIPRINAWAVTGTPVRKDIDDLRGLLIFLRYHLPGGGKFDNKSVFRQIFNQLAVRHNKDKIRNELQIPPQKRVVINVPFTVIEQQNYSEMVRQMCDACWFSPTGEPLRNDRDADHPEVIERMREWLIRLRQTCLHAHVGSRNKKALSVRGGPLRTLDKVLEVMIDKNNSSIMTEARELMLLQLKRGHIHAYAKNVHIRSKTALPYYESALAQAQSYVQLCRDELAQGQQKFGLSAVALDDEMLIDDHAEDVEPEDQTGQITVLRQRLRTFLEVEHACNFFIGSTYFQLKENDRLTKPDSSEFNNLEALEELWYSKAKEVRKELLKDAQDRTQHQIENIKRKTSTAIQIIPEICERPGIESAKVFKMMETITGILNAQSSQLQEWRSKIVGFLTTPLVDQDGEKENTGDEYEDSTKTQDELYVYMMALRTLIADQNTLVNGSHDLLVDHEFKEAVKMARDENPGKRGHAPELVLEIAKIRQKLQPQATHGSLKGAISLTRSLITNLQWKSGTVDNRAATESAVLENYLDRIQDITSQQAKGVLDLEKQLDVFRTTMNLRLEFYRQLQHISDTVAPWKEELDQTFDYMQDEKLEGDQKAKEKNLARLKAKQSFFATLRSEGQQQDLDRDCIICTNTIEDGVLTTCGHRVSALI
jgi:E3 ubiquitin-protein ligase SHPRH